MDIDCNTYLNKKQFPGDPGSVFVVKCPSFCSVVSLDLLGTGIYSYKSPICKAAVHAGIMLDL